MLALLLCCMMKIVEFSTGKPVGNQQLMPRRYKRRRHFRRGKTMNEVGVGGRITALTPDSDCNSNHPGSNSCLSNTSSQDIDFIQDNSDYQWFLDYNYRDGSTNHHTSILSLSEAYDANDVGYYDTLAKNMDANLAEADMESFKTEDIHALLTNLPTMCTDPISQDTRQGESFASVSGSMMANFDFDSSLSPHSSSHGEDSANSTSMSICKSELLFSPVKELPMPGAHFSVDSLDCELMNEHDIMLTCQANKDNYTIAFEGSATMYSEDNDYHDNDKSESASRTESSRWASNIKTQAENIKRIDASMAQSDSGGFTTWSKLKKLNSDNQLRRHPSGNNNTSEDIQGRFCITNNAMKSQSMPNLYKHKMKGLFANSYLKNHNMLNSLIDPSIVKRRSVKVFDIQHQLQSNSLSGGSLVSEMATSADGASSSSESHKQHQQQNFNLVKLFMKQKSLSAEGMSTAMDQSSISENWPTQSNASHESLDCKQQNQCETKLNYFEDSLLIDPKSTDTNSRTHDLIIEEQDEETSKSESIGQLTESISKLESVGESYENNKFNVNNNNSIEHNEPVKRRLKVHSTQTRRLNNSSSTSSNCSSHSSFSDRANLVRQFSRTNGTQVPIHLMNKSMQTSCYIDKNLINAPYKLNCHNVADNVKVVQPSFLNKLKSEVKEKPVYVVYPNYVLPDLDFLSSKEDDLDKVVLMPQRGPVRTLSVKKRPYSCNDIEVLKQRGFNHIRDWDSLNFLLPKEYRQILADVPELAQKINPKGQCQKPSFCVSPPVRRKLRPASCDLTALDRTSTSSSSSTATQPSSGYRGSSTMLLTDSQNSPVVTNTFNPLFVYRYDSVTSSEASLKTSERQRSTTTAPPLPKRSISLSQDNGKKGEFVPPRPPLPKGILRKTLENAKLRKSANAKRHSMFEVTEDEMLEELSNKRYSLQEHGFSRRNKRLSETEDEGVDAGTSSSSMDEQLDGNVRIPISPKNDTLLSMINGNELHQLEEYLKINGITLTDSEELDEEGYMQLRSCISKFVVLKLNEQSGDQLGGKKTVSFAKNVELKPPNNSPNASAFSQQKHYQGTNLLDMPIHEESETNLDNYSSPYQTLTHVKRQTYDLNQKRLLVSAVPDGVEKLIHNFAPATNQNELITLGNSHYNPTCARIALSSLCPTIYAILSDGLKSSLETSFGPISNSVWQVVEASAQQGPLTKALNDLVMRINSEDVITEGLVKFNAFILGLLNVRSLDAWISYLRTRESVLKKHYNSESLLLLAHTGGTSVRGLLDTLVTALEPLALLPFQFDLLFEYRQLHQSLNRMDSYHQPTSPTYARPSPVPPKQWNYSKFGHSMQSNSTHSNSDTEDISVATTVKHLSPEHTSDQKSLPDLLNSSSNAKVQTKTERIRPRSCVEPAISMKPNFRVGDDVASTAKKRWSGISLSSKLYQAYDRLGDDADEEYTDSLENCPNRAIKACKQDDKSSGGSSNEGFPHLPEDAPESLESNLSDDKPLNGRRFKKLQQKWEMLSGKESDSPPSSPVHKSKIPIPVTSPVQSSGIPIPITSPTSKLGIKKVITPPGCNKKCIPAIKPTSGSHLIKTGATKKVSQNSRTSRLDQLANTNDTPKHIPRPSSLPYRPVSVQNKTSKAIPSRRAVSTSLNRKPVLQTQNSKMVRTLSHRLPSESGHLSYNEGECLKVILEVDEKWLLCCRGTQKGLVPRSAVIAENGRF